MTSSPPMVMWPDVGGLMSAMAVSSVDLPAPLGPSSADHFAARHSQRHVPHGHDFGVAAAIDFREVAGLDGGRLLGGRVHTARTVLGSTLIAFQMPSRLASTEMTTTIRPSEMQVGRLDQRRGGESTESDTAPATTPGRNRTRP